MRIPTEGDPVLMSIEQRISEWTMTPLEHGETLYATRSRAGESYEPHYDYFSDPTEMGGAHSPSWRLPVPHKADL